MPGDLDLAPAPLRNVQAGRVHQDVAPPEARADHLGHLIHILRDAHIGRRDDRLAAAVADRGCRLLQRIDPAPAQHELRAGRGKRHRGCSADPRARTRHPRDLALDRPLHVASPF
jgi:non-ribosomal peptide synthetase component F